MLPIALNHMSVAHLGWRAFLDAASRLGCMGVEFRNDLDTPLFSGDAPEVVAAEVRAKGLRLLGLSQVYPFNAWSDGVARDVEVLIQTAKACGAETISLIPRNDGKDLDPPARQDNLRTALREIRPMLEAAELVGLIEPLGFESASLRSKAEAIEAIEAVASRDQFQLVHDTFHHFLAGGGDVFPDWTGLVHVSGVERQNLALREMDDAHRVLVGPRDRLGNIKQIQSLVAGGCACPISMEAFAPKVHAMHDPIGALGRSFTFIRQEVHAP